MTQEIDAVRRTVGSRTLEAGEARIVTVGRTHPAASHPARPRTMPGGAADRSTAYTGAEV